MCNFDARLVKTWSLAHTTAPVRARVSDRGDKAPPRIGGRGDLWLGHGLAGGDCRLRALRAGARKPRPLDVPQLLQLLPRLGPHARELLEGLRRALCLQLDCPAQAERAQLATLHVLVQRSNVLWRQVAVGDLEVPRGQHMEREVAAVQQLGGRRPRGPGLSRCTEEALLGCVMGWGFRVCIHSCWLWASWF